jgi:hypothetical protein
MTNINTVISDVIDSATWDATRNELLCGAIRVEAQVLTLDITNEKIRAVNRNIIKNALWLEMDKL